MLQSCLPHYLSAESPLSPWLDTLHWDTDFATLSNDQFYSLVSNMSLLGEVSRLAEVE